MRYLYFLMLVSTLLYFSCSKDKSYQGPSNPTGTDTSFQPVTAGSTWHYQDSLQGNFTLTSTGNDTTMAGIKYYIFRNQQDTSSQVTESYFGQDQVSYYVSGLLSELQDNVLLYLKDTTLNASWQQNIAVVLPGYGNVTANIIYTLAKKDYTMTVNQAAYKNVSDVSFQIKIPVPGLGSISYATGDWYFARGVGLISVQAKSNSSVIISATLLSYTVK